MARPAGSSPQGCALLTLIKHHFLFALILFYPFCVHSYPKAWWEPFPKDKAASWEILPQEAKEEDNEVILSKRTELGIFSNFANTPFDLDNTPYASVEGLWQSLKYPDSDDPKDPRHALTWIYTRAAVRNLYGFEAKKAGNNTKENYTKLGISWVSYKGRRMEYKGKDQAIHYRLIKRAILAKILQNKNARDLLLQTGNLKLRPDHIQDKDVPPAYRYYDILMDIRTKLQRTAKKKRK
ncbi:MAG: hypothetical protein A3B70_05170 [Deltaproteobacteria bacterium RIFCSPHIGHO2_02_FULL_40_11]|nr:MAG: hypothetical protein A3B70_05170 [Deltaproteobacteria bacterium RIFCSPHIGHO2_02_FULL_40_11]